MCECVTNGNVGAGGDSHYWLPPSTQCNVLMGGWSRGDHLGWNKPTRPLLTLPHICTQHHTSTELAGKNFNGSTSFHHVQYFFLT